MLPEYFEYHNPTKLMVGNGALENIPYELGRLGAKKVFVIISRTMLESEILELIGGGIRVEIVTDIPKDSSFKMVEMMAQQARTTGCDSIMAIGGGSVLDTAKAVRGLLAQQKDSVRELLGSEWMTRGRFVPFIVVPTTSGTGSECTAVAVVQDDKTGLKHEIVSSAFLPDNAVLDARCTENLPPRLTASCGMDALAHAIEAYTGQQKNPLSDAYARSAVKLIGSDLITAVREPKNLDARLSMACASTMAGMAFSNSMVGLVHAVAHSLGTVCNMPHGEAVGLMLPKVMRWQMDRCGEGYGELLGEFCGEEYFAHTPYHKRGEKLVRAIEDTMIHLNQKCGIPISLREAGVGRKSFQTIAQLTLNDGALMNNPKPADRENIINILQTAY